MREVLRGKSLSSDLLAGLTVAAVALPLNIALAVASGLPASAGLVAGAIGGGIAALFGGASLQVTGPAAALSTMVLALATELGPIGVAAGCVVIGLTQLVLGFLGAGRFAKHIPESVLGGFTTGVGLKLLDGQLPEVLGFEILGYNHKFVDIAAMMHKPQWLHHVSWSSVTCGLIVAFMVTRLSSFKRFPAAIVGIALTTFLSVYLHWNVERVGEIPARFPQPSFPIVPDERWIDLLVHALPLGLLASLESMLAARGIDRMTPGAKPHNSNLELVGQGLANLSVGFMSGLPVSGVVVRSTVNVQSGAKTRLAAFTHAVLLVLAVLYLSRVIALVPVSALAGLLIVIGLRLLDWKELVHLAKTDRIGAGAFLLTMAGTVSGHLLSGLVAGLVVHFINQYLRRHERAQAKVSEENLERGVRAVLGHEHAHARRPDGHALSPDNAKWLALITSRGHRAKSAFVHEQASVVGRVVMGEHVHIAAGSSVRADEGSPFFIGENTNLQDGVVLHALKDRRVVVAGEEWAIYVGKDVSIAHNALVHGPCYVGDHTFVGFKSVVHDSVVGANCFIGHGAIVVGVEIPDGRFVPNGRIIDSADAVASLGPATHRHAEFNEDVVEVNRGLASAYRHAESAQLRPSLEDRNAHEPLVQPSWASAWPSPPNPTDRF